MCTNPIVCKLCIPNTIVFSNQPRWSNPTRTKALSRLAFSGQVSRSQRAQGPQLGLSNLTCDENSHKVFHFLFFSSWPGNLKTASQRNQDDHQCVRSERSKTCVCAHPSTCVNT
eukprot:1569107-Rhodomonas_salina.1